MSGRSRVAACIGNLLLSALKACARRDRFTRLLAQKNDLHVTHYLGWYFSALHSLADKGLWERHAPLTYDTHSYPLLALPTARFHEENLPLFSSLSFVCLVESTQISRVIRSAGPQDDRAF